jgi:hypothetical protein
LNVTDGKVYVESPLTLTINVSEVNDPPVITKVGVKDAHDHSVTLIETQGVWTNLTVEANDDIDGDPLVFDTDVKTVISGSKEGVNYDFDAETGDLHFKTSDKEVGTIYVNLSCNDGRGGVDWVILTVKVNNANDPPTLNKINDKMVDQFEWLNFTMKAADLDIDSEDELTFYTNISEAIPKVVQEEDYFIDTATGDFSFNPIYQRQVGEWEVTFGVKDKAEAKAEQTVMVTVKDINERPIANIIQIEGGYKNLTITASTEAAYDPDGDLLTYYWDFGDDSGEESGADLVSLMHNYTEAGPYNISLYVTDGYLDSPLQVMPFKVVAPGEDVPDDVGEVWEGFSPGKKGNTEVTITFDTCKMVTKFEEDSPTAGKTTMTTNYEFSGTCSENVKAVHIYWGTQVNDGSYTYLPFMHPEDLEMVKIKAENGKWSKKFDYSLTYPTPSSSDDDVEPTGDTFTTWFAAVGWTEDGKYAIAEKEADLTGTSGGGEGTSGMGGILLLIIILAIILLIGIIIIVVVVIVGRGKKKKKEEEPAPPPPPQAAEPQMAAQAEPMPQPMPEPQPGHYEEEPLLEPTPAMGVEGQEGQPQLPDYSQPALPPPTEMSIEEPPSLHEEPPMGEEPGPDQKQEDLDALFSDISQEETPREAPPPAPETGGPAFGESLPVEEVQGEEPAPPLPEQPQDDMIGQTLEVACHNCGEMMAVEIVQRPQVIVCWNCQAEGMIE